MAPTNFDKLYRVFYALETVYAVETSHKSLLLINLTAHGYCQHMTVKTIISTITFTADFVVSH